MKVLIVYESQFGNTEKIARAMGEEIGVGENNQVTVTKPKSLKELDTDNLNLLIVGSPTQAGKAVSSIDSFIKAIPADSLKGVKYATFDTRMEMFIAKLFGYAGPRIAKALKPTGGQLISPPAGFIVTDKEGPLKAGELERAKIWARDLIA